MRSMKLISAVLLFLLPIQTSLSDFTIEKLRSDPEMRIEDAYKWLYQATRGNEHAVGDERMVREYLQQEWATIGNPLINESLWEPLRADEKLGRLNLRPFRARGGRMEDLALAFIESAREFRGNELDFRAAWSELGLQVARAPVGKLTWQEWRRLDEAMRAKNFPRFTTAPRTPKRETPPIV
jgi:hypothetical protein